MFLRSLVVALALFGTSAEHRDVNITKDLDVHGDLDIHGHVNAHNITIKFDPDAHSRWNGTLHMDRDSVISVGRNATIEFTEGAGTSSGTMLLNGTALVSGSVSLLTPIITGPDSIINVTQGAVLQASTVTGQGTLLVDGTLNATAVATQTVMIQDSLTVNDVTVTGALTVSLNATLVADTLTVSTAAAPATQRRLLASTQSGSCFTSVFTGSGPVGCTVTVTGTLDPTRSLACQGLVQDLNSTSLFTVPGDLVTVLGAVELGGTIHVTFTGPPGDTVLITGQSISGTFSAATFSGLVSGMSAQVVATNTEVRVVTSVPIPADPFSPRSRVVIGVLSGLTFFAGLGYFVQRRHYARRRIVLEKEQMQNPLFSA